MPAPIVFFDIAGPDDAALAAFYSSVFDWEIGADRRFSVTAASDLGGAIRRDPTEKRIYIGVLDVEDCLARIVAAGGAIDAPRFEVPGVVVLGLFRDPAGNPMGLVELDGAHPKIP
ncbi:MAG: VOC family protein [Pseudomonadota bacterium]